VTVATNRQKASLVVLRELGRSALIGSTAAMAAGLLAGGIGSRIAMSMVALADPRSPAFSPPTTIEFVR